MRTDASEPAADQSCRRRDKAFSGEVDMKRIITLLSVFLTFFIAVPICAAAEDGIGHEAQAEVDEMMREYGVDLSTDEVMDISPGGLWERLKADITAPSLLLGSILLVTVFTAVVGSLGEGIFSSSSASLYNMVSVGAAAAVLVPQLLSQYDRTLTAIDRGGSFMLVFVPTFAGITIATGGVASGSLYNMMILGAAEFVTTAADSLLMPILSISAVLAISGSIFPRAQVDALAALLKKAVVWSVTVISMLFTGFVSLKCTLAGKADGSATKAAKFMMSGMMPVVGGAVSDAYSVVRSGFDVLRGTVGTAGTFAVILLMLPPVLELIAFRAVIMIGSAAAELLSAVQIKKLLSGIDSGLAIAQSVLIGFGMMFILCTAILMQAVK